MSLAVIVRGVGFSMVQSSRFRGLRIECLRPGAWRAIPKRFLGGLRSRILRIGPNRVEPMTLTTNHTECRNLTGKL